jgi:DNA-directed RNA polymerase specialized sigma24 family protein
VTDSGDFADLGRKLDTLISIQAAIAVKDMATQRDKIVFLYGLGMGPTQIAALLRTTPKTVSVAMAKHKKALAEKGEGDE